MPQINKKEQRCLKCGKIRQITMYPEITASEMPSLKEAILEEKLFDFTCSSCGFNADYAYPVLYHDKERKYMIYYTLNSKAADEARLPIYLKQVKKRTVSDLKELKEKILIFDAMYDDIAIEIVKSAIEKIIAKKYNDTNTKIYFVRGEGSALVFAVYFSNSANAVYQSANIKLYNQALDILDDSGYKEENAFLRVDRAFAAEIINKSR